MPAMVAVARPSTLGDQDPWSAEPTLGEGVSSVRLRAPYRGTDERIRRSPAAQSHPAGALVVDPRAAEVVDPEADVAVLGQLHVPADSAPDEPLPLLVVHDGPEYADLAQLLRYVTTLARIEPALRCRVLLLQPVDRDRSYSASPAYARALVTRMLPKVSAAVATAGRPVGVGASLGGLAMLHAATSYPGTFAGVFSQSGSFFRPRTDGMERGYRHYNRIVRFVDGIDADSQRLADLTVTMTCGTGEENLANNRSLTRRLTRQGVPTQLIENPDGHNYTGWRDCLDPGLRLLLRAAWGRTGNTPG
jgi:enterochelin esterase family protein